MMSKARVAIVVPAFRGIPQTTMNYIQRMVEDAAAQDVDCADLYPEEGCYIHIARNMATTKVLRQHEKGNRYTHILYLDDDNLLSAEDLLKLIAADKPVIGGLYFMRTRPTEPVAFMLDAPGKPMRSVSAEEVARGEPMEVEVVGGGCILCKMDAIYTLAEFWINCVWEQQWFGLSGDRLHQFIEKRMHWWEVRREAMWFDFNSTMGTTIGEDVGFCIMARAAGMTPWLHCGTNVGHMGQHIYDIEDYRRDLAACKRQ